MSDHAKRLLKAADEIRARNYAGWGNTCEDAAKHIQRLEAQLAAAEQQIDGLQNHARKVQAKLAAAEADAGRWMDVSVDGYPDKACEVLIARGNATVFGAWIGDSFWYSNEKVAALFWRHLPKPPDPARGVE
tara:strand:- start:1186 stop:1581 length:396 start_codon:yes stop_codon:yes gene_type:complete